MIGEEQQARRRAANRDFLERRSSAALVKPYVRQITVWQARVAYLRAGLGVPKLNGEQRLAICVELNAVRSDLLVMLEDVRAVSGEGPPSGRVRDVILALERLDQQLREALARSEEFPPPPGWTSQPVLPV